MCVVRFSSLILLAIAVAPLAFSGDPTPESLVRAGHWKRPRPLAEQLYRRNPDDAQAAYLLSQVKMAFGDLEGALPLAEKAVVLDGSNASYHYQLAAVCGALAEHASLFKKASWAKPRAPKLLVATRAITRARKEIL